MSFVERLCASKDCKGRAEKAAKPRSTAAHGLLSEAVIWEAFEEAL